MSALINAAINDDLSPLGQLEGNWAVKFIIFIFKKLFENSETSWKF